MHFKTGVGCVGGAIADRDGDGFADDVDRCPDIAGVAPDGCPTHPHASMIHDRFTELTPGALRDEQTGIQWQRVAPPETFRYSDAVNYCGHLQVDHGGWRLPTKDELRSLVRKGSTPRIDTAAFPSTPAEDFWTSTPSVGSIMSTMSFRSGDEGSSPAGIAQHVRCARTRGHR